MTKQEIEKKEAAPVALQEGPVLGFNDDEGSDDLIIPRVKVIQTLSPERKEKTADEGDIINSLTGDRLNGKVFIPVFTFINNILWKDRNDGGGMECSARDGKHGMYFATGEDKMCSLCRKCEFDNSKQGREAIPTCTKYRNFLGFFRGETLPIILSFSKTSYNEGKRIYSMMKVSQQNIFNFGYKINEKLMSKNGNEWYIAVAELDGDSTPEERVYARSLFETFSGSYMNLKFDTEEDNGDPIAEQMAKDNDSEY